MQYISKIESRTFVKHIMPIALMALTAMAVMGGCETGQRQDEVLDTNSKPRPQIPDNANWVKTPLEGPMETLCCGKCDAGSSTCSNCAILPPLSTCHGAILACPDGEVITDSGEGFCA